MTLQDDNLTPEPHPDQDRREPPVRLKHWRIDGTHPWDPKYNPLVEKDRYFTWQKALLRSGDRSITRVADVAVLVVGYGFYGHGAYPALETVSGASGLSERQLVRNLKPLVDGGWLLPHRSNRRPTMYCIRLPGDPGAEHEGRCRLCFGGQPTTGTDDGRRPSPTTDHLLDDPLLRPLGVRAAAGAAGSAAAPAEEVQGDADQARAALELLYEHRPGLTEAQAAAFLDAAREVAVDRGWEAISTLIPGYAAWANYVTQNSAGKYLGTQRLPKTPKERKVTQKQLKAQQQEAFITASDRRSLISLGIRGWEEARGAAGPTATDEDGFPRNWEAAMDRCDLAYADQVLQQWLDAGRGPLLLPAWYLENNQHLLEGLDVEVLPNDPDDGRLRQDDHPENDAGPQPAEEPSTAPWFMVDEDPF